MLFVVCSVNQYYFLLTAVVLKCRKIYMCDLYHYQTYNLSFKTANVFSYQSAFGKYFSNYTFIHYNFKI